METDDHDIPRIRGSARGHWYITEHLRAAGLSDEQVGNRIGRNRSTVFKWRKTPYRLDEGQLRELASAIGTDFDYRKFHRLPEGRAPVKDDPVEEAMEMIVSAPPEDQRKAVDVLAAMFGRRRTG